MNLWLRVLRVLIASLFRPRLGFMESSHLSFRVMPTDLDINIHMNNARYLAIMDLGRWDLVLRSGLWRLVLSMKLQAVLGGTMVRFRRSLKPFQPFSLSTRLIAWDERWFYIEHLMREADGAVACSAVMRAGFVRNGRLMPPAELAEAVGYAGPTLAPPPWLQGWREAEKGFEHQEKTGEDRLCAR